MGSTKVSNNYVLASLPMDLIGFGYAALVTIGSVLGYKRRGGVPSLIAGLSVGLLAGYGAYRVSNDRRDVKVSLFTAFFLATIMGVRFKRSKKVMPAGLVAGLREYFQVASGKLGHRKNESPLLPLRRAVTEPSEPTAQGHDRAVHSRPVHQRDCPSVFLFL